MLEHGGNLQHAIRLYGRPKEDWIDLSTGINPHSYPVPDLPHDIWHRLPEHSLHLVEAARSYYNAPNILPVAGSQAAIQALPRLRAAISPYSRVTVADLAYSEHAVCWSNAGHVMNSVSYDELGRALKHSDVMVVCNPNNPTGTTIAPEVLLEWAGQLSSRGGWLIVDEAFADPTPELSIAACSNRSGIIVLRSIGKFFGLAGLRLGFVAASASLLEQLSDIIGPWTVSSAAQRIGCSALQDKRWQEATRETLRMNGRRLHGLLNDHGIRSTGTALYQWWACENAQSFKGFMAERGIWVRLFTASTPGIRIGLPQDEKGWQRLDQALDEWSLLEMHK
jgi:cobalamin biosynthetic protein CobC